MLRLAPKKKKKARQVREHAMRGSGGEGVARARPRQATHPPLLLLLPQGVRWAEEVVDNEFLNKRSSKSE